jgi:hypothetical protein
MNDRTFSPQRDRFPVLIFTQSKIKAINYSIFSFFVTQSTCFSKSNVIYYQCCNSNKSEANPAPWKVRGWLWLQSMKGVKLIMTKKQCLKPWAVARLLPNQKWAIIGRYRNPSDANGHLLLLRQRVSNIQFKVVFDMTDCKQ